MWLKKIPRNHFISPIFVIESPYFIGHSSPWLLSIFQPPTAYGDLDLCSAEARAGDVNWVFENPFRRYILAYIFIIKALTMYHMPKGGHLQHQLKLNCIQRWGRIRNGKWQMQRIVHWNWVLVLCYVALWTDRRLLHMFARSPPLSLVSHSLRPLYLNLDIFSIQSNGYRVLIKPKCNSLIFDLWT